MKENKIQEWIRLEPLLSKISEVANNVNENSYKERGKLLIKDISLDLACFLDNDSNDVQVFFPSPGDHNNSNKLTKIKITCEIFQNAFQEKDL